MPENFYKNKRVKEIRELLVKKPKITSPDSSLENLIDKILSGAKSRHVYVTDKNNKLLGSIRLNSLIDYIFPNTIFLGSIENFMIYPISKKIFLKTANEIMNIDPSYVKDETLITDMIKIMKNEQINELPVVDKNMIIIGEVNLFEVLIYYKKNKL